MRTSRALGGLVAVVLCLSAPLFGAIQLTPVATGLSSPFVHPTINTEGSTHRATTTLRPPIA